MKKVISSIILFFCASFFYSVAFAGVTLPMEGSGSVKDAVKAFEKVVVINNGLVDNNSKTDFGSVGNFGDYRAKMYAEEKNGIIHINVRVTREKAELLAYVLSGGKNNEMDIAVLLRESLKKEGYQLSNEKE